MIALTSVAESRFALHQTSEAKAPAPPPDKCCRQASAPSGCEVSISPQAQAKSREVTGAEATAVEPSQLNPYAAAIFGHIEAQLLRDVADGATSEELQARLQAGVDGFLEGYGEALTQLEHQPGFTDSIARQVALTQDQVLAAIKTLADELGLEPPVVTLADAGEEPLAEPGVDPADARLALPDAVAVARDQLLVDKRTSDITLLVDTLERTTLTYEHLGKTRKSSPVAQTYRSLETRSFNLELKTLDGDTVNLTIRSEKASHASLPGGGGFATATEAKDQLSFSVDGDLDEGELRAISELLSDVNNLAHEFYQGDYTQALLEAQNLRFDDAELASFDLDLEQTQVETYNRTWTGQDALADEGEAGLRDYARQLLVEAGRSVQLGYSASLVVEFVEQIELMLDKNGMSDFARELLIRNDFYQGGS